MRRGDFHGNDVLLAPLDVRRNVEFVTAESADDLIRAGDFLAVDPDISAVVDATESEPHSIALELSRNFEFIAVPPGNGERTIGRHFLIGEFRADLVGDAWHGTQVHAEVRVLVDAVFDEDPSLHPAVFKQYLRTMLRPKRCVMHSICTMVLTHRHQNTNHLIQ